ncbi:MAG: ribonuclease E/G [Pseudomonadota bacterium]
MAEKRGSAQIFVAERGGERHVALWRKDRLAAYRLEGPALRDRTGALYQGRVVRVEKGLGAAFVLFDAGETGMLPLRRGERRVEGERVLVQLARERRGDKAPRLTGAPILEGRFVDLLSGEPGVHMGGAALEAEAARAIRASLRKLADGRSGFRLTARAAGAPSDAILAEAASLQAAWQRAVEAQVEAEPETCLLPAPDAVLALVKELPGVEHVRVIADTRVLARRIEDALDAAAAQGVEVLHMPSREWSPSAGEIGEALLAALEPRVPLPDGPWLLLEPGETLTAIDVNSGEATARRGSLDSADARLKLDLAACGEIAHQLRLRNIGGIVVIDFVELEGAAERDLVTKRLRTALAGDPARTRVLPMSDLGLVQLTRQLRGPTLADLFLAPCERCGGVGRLVKRQPIGASGA